MAKQLAAPAAPVTMVSTAQAVQLFDTTPDRLALAAKWGFIPKATKAGYPLPALVRGFARYIASGEVTPKEAGLMIGTSDEWVRKLIAEGYVQRTERGNVTKDNVAAGYIRWLKDEDRRSTKTAAASRKDDARTREIELRVAEREHRLIDIEEHDAVLDEIVAIIRAGLAGLPARATRDVSERRRIETELDDILRKASARIAERGAELRSSGLAAPAVAEGDA